MRRVLISIYTLFYSKNELRGCMNTNKLKWAVANIMFRVAQYLLYYNLKLSKLLGGKPERLNPDGNIIVSLTSFPARINDIWMVVDSIMRQSVKPNRIILNLTKKEFPNGNKDLPQSIVPYIDLGLEVAYRDCNLRSHLKYYYTIQENPNSLVITVDDDLYYADYTIERLINLHQQYPNAVCSNRARVITFDKDGRVNPYSQWISNSSITFLPSNQLLALGYGGVLYPTNLFTDKRLFDKEIMREKCLKADDLWLKTFELLNEIPVVTGDYFCIPAEIRGSQVVSLMSSNCNSATPLNDVQWSNLDSMYALNKLLNNEP